MTANGTLTLIMCPKISQRSSAFLLVLVHDRLTGSGSAGAFFHIRTQLVLLYRFRDGRSWEEAQSRPAGAEDGPEQSRHRESHHRGPGGGSRDASALRAARRSGQSAAHLQALHLHTDSSRLKDRTEPALDSSFVLPVPLPSVSVRFPV